MVWNKLVSLYVLVYSFIISSNAVESDTNVFHNKPNTSTGIEVNGVVEISDTLLVPIRLEISDEINIEIKNNINNDNVKDIKTQFKNQNDKESYIPFIDPASTTQKISTEEKINQNIPKCCLIIDPPKCNWKQCVIKRTKICWNICTGQIMIREAPGFPKEKLPVEFIPPKWQTQAFSENLVINLIEPKTENYGTDNSKQPYTYQNNPTSPYFYQNIAATNIQPAYHIPYNQNFYGQLPSGYNYYPYFGYF